jgi:hypothetical protein
VSTHRLGQAVPRRAGVALAAVGAVLALASPSLADGGTWKPDPSPNPSSIGNTLSGVSARTGTDAWAVGWYTDEDRDNGRNMLAARWDGAAWTEISTPDLARSDEGLLAVSASSADEAWAVGFTDRFDTLATSTLAVHWDGVAWTVVPTPATSGSAPANLAGVVSFSPTSAWAVGRTSLSTGNTSLIVHWNGTAWSTVPSPNPTVPPGTTVASATLTSISAVSPNDIWAVGSFTVSGGFSRFQNFTLVEHFDGKFWSVVPSPTDPKAGTNNGVLNGVVAVGANDVWAVGDTFDTRTGLPDTTLVEHWDGTAWAGVPRPSVLTEDTLTGVTAVSPTDVWAVGQAVDRTGTNPVTKPLTLHWDGASWSVVASPTGPTGDATLFATAAAPDTGEVWAVGATGSTPVNTFIIHR